VIDLIKMVVLNTNDVVGTASLQRILLFIFVIILSIIAGNILKILIIKVLKKRASPVVYKAISRVTMYAVYLFGFYFAFQKILNFNVPAFLAALGILGITLLLTMLPVLQNIFAGIVLSIERLIKENDVVEVDGTTCIVKDIMLRKTVLRSLDGKLITLPNMNLVTGKVVNCSSGEFIRVELSISIRNDPNYKAVIESIDKILLEDPRVLPHIPKKEMNVIEKLFSMPKNLDALKPQIFIKKIENGIITLQVWFWIWDILKKEIIVSNFYESVLIEFKRNKISFG